MRYGDETICILGGRPTRIHVLWAHRNALRIGTNAPRHPPKISSQYSKLHIKLKQPRHFAITQLVISQKEVFP